MAGYPPPPPSDPAWGQQMGGWGGAGTAGGTLAGWGSRVGATLVDFLVLIVPFVIILVALHKAIFLAYLILIIIQGLYQSLQVGSRGQTIGNRAAGTKVVDASTGAIPTKGKAWGRWGVETVISIIPFGGIVDILWPLWDARNQTLHDKAVGTVVIKS